MPGIPGIANPQKYKDAQVSFHILFMEELESQGMHPGMGLATEVPSTTSIEEYQWLEDLPGVSEWKGDRKIATLLAQNLRVANKDWQNAISVGKNQIDDDKLGLVRPKIAGLARKFNQHKGALIARVLLNGFTGTSYPYLGNGVAYTGSLFFSTTHSVAGGPQQSNLITTPLSEAGLAAAEEKLLSMTTWDGQDELELEPTALIVGPKLKHKAAKLIGAKLLAIEAETASETNVYEGMFKLIVLKQLRGAFADHWMLGALEEPLRPALFQMRQDVETMLTDAGDGQQVSEDMFRTKTMKFGADARYNAALLEPRVMVGSTGTGA